MHKNLTVESLMNLTNSQQFIIIFPINLFSLHGPSMYETINLSPQKFV